jgi:hypothetical protein
MFRRTALTAILVLCCLVADAAPSRKLYPVDEGPRDPSFVAFRQKLIKACKRRDWRFLNTTLDPRVVSGFGASEGLQEFKDEWEPEDPDTDLWETLLEVLSMGGAFLRPGCFEAPYVSARWPKGLEGETHHAVVGRNVPVRSRPSPMAPVVERLSYDIVRELPQSSQPVSADNTVWTRIVTPSGRQGYVASEYLRNPFNPQATFVKKNGKWWLTRLTWETDLGLCVNRWRA